MPPPLVIATAALLAAALTAVATRRYALAALQPAPAPRRLDRPLALAARSAPDRRAIARAWA